MLDTIRAKIAVPVNRVMDPTQWEQTTHFRTGLAVDRQGEMEECGFVDLYAQHRPTGLRLFGKGQYTVLEASLPRVLFGSNGKLLKSQGEVDAALCEAFQLVDQAAVGDRSGWDLREIARADLAWQFPGDPATWFLAHRNAKHPTIRRRVQRCEFFGLDFSTGLTWRGRNHMVRLYDKQLEQSNEPGGQVVRSELEMRGSFLESRLSRDPAKVFDFNRCYSVFRDFFRQFDPCPVAEVHNLPALLALADRHQLRVHGVSLFELWSLHKSRWSRRRMRKQMESIELREFGVDWHSLLPSGAPATFAEVGERPVSVSA